MSNDPSPATFLLGPPDGRWFRFIEGDESGIIAELERRGFDWRDLTRYDSGHTFVTVRLDEIWHRVAFMTFPGVYAMNLTEEFVLAAEKTIKEHCAVL